MKPAASPKQTEQPASVFFTINFAELTLEQELGRGGFGVVYKATYRHNDVAVKQLLSPDISSDSAQEFETECQVMAQLRSPNIVQFYGYSITPKRCIVMEYMPSGSLFSLLRNNQPIEWTMRFRIAADITHGLAYLHQENILHQNIKSPNVLLNHTFQAKLTDFGLPKMRAEIQSHKRNKDSVSTIAWMAPELYKKNAVFTQKSDVYSLGMTFWELASRKTPFANEKQNDNFSWWIEEGLREDLPTDCPTQFSNLIQQCWEGDPAKRPDTNIIFNQLKIILDAFSPQYKGTVTPDVPPQPLVFSSLKLTPQASPAAIVVQKLPVQAAIPNPLKQAPKVDAKDMIAFLKLVAEGEQDQAGEMLQKNKDLALLPTDVTDLSNRTFKNITGFQYAVWALDWNMWTMIRKYLPDEEAVNQLKAMETGSWVSQHGKSASWQNLLDALQKYIDLCAQKKWDEAKTQWQKQVGGAQRLLPVHVVNEYCHPTRPFEPCPDFTKPDLLARSRKMDQGEWFIAVHNGGKLGDKFACYRYSCAGVKGRGEQSATGGVLGQVEHAIWRSQGGAVASADLKSCHALLATRAQQRNQLFAELLQALPLKQPLKVDAKDFNTFFLKLVAEGEQDQVETLLQKDKDFALASSDVTDLSNRTFKNITGFQYAVWALDWNMWVMIRKYLPDEEARKQIESMETGSWVTQHGKSASWQNLLDALQKQIDLLKQFKRDEAETQWQKQVGGTQRLLPVHVVNEYCHPTHPLEPCPDFTEPGLPRSRKMDKGEWFTAVNNGGKLGEKFACYRYSFSVVMPWEACLAYWYKLEGDYKSCHALLVTRTQQRDQLFAELLSKNFQGVRKVFG